MKLYLARHAKALADDPDPGLSDTGKQQAQTMADILVERHCNIQCILHSDKKRAQETASIYAKVLHLDDSISVQEGLHPNDPIEPIIELISKEKNDLMLVGHLPFMNILSTYLMTKQDEEYFVFDPATIVCFQKDGNAWYLEWCLAP